MKRPSLLWPLAGLLALGLLFGPRTGYAQSDTAAVYTLSRCVALALDHNLQARQADWQTEKSRLDLLSARGNVLPFVAGGVTHGINQGRSIDPFTNSYVNQEVSFANYGLSGSITLWNGQTLQHTVQQTRLAYEAGKLERQQLRENITISVLLAYLQVLNSDEQLNQARQQTRVTADQVARLRVLDSSGTIAPALLADLKGQLATDQLNELTARGNAQTARLTLAQLLNIPFNPALRVSPLPEALSPTNPAAAADVGQLVLTATATLPHLKAAELRLRSAQKGVRAARGMRLPALYAFGNLGTTYSSAANRATLLGTSEVATGNYVVVGPDRVPVYTAAPTYRSSVIPYAEQWRNNVFSTIGLGLRIPLLNGNQARTQRGLARLAEQQADVQVQVVTTQLQQAVTQAVLNQQLAQERYQALTGQVADFTQSFRAAEARFAVGVTTSVDYVVAKNNLDRARSNLIAARYDVALRRQIVAYYAGKAQLP
ncbi:MAG: TolC family protein [Hymenobacteraceae bacterium]|nr:TolC family protein [Hymenobacteraceae bacterium]